MRQTVFQMYFPPILPKSHNGALGNGTLISTGQMQSVYPESALNKTAKY